MMKLPTVTETDLLNFHHRHFSHAPLPSDFFLHRNEAVDNNYDDCDDDLGYYPDGVKRTLTDEDIAWLREREIRDLRRQRHTEQSPSPPPDNEAQAPEEPLADGRSDSASLLQPDIPDSPDTTTSARPMVQYDKSFMKGLPAFTAAPIPYVPRANPSQNPNGIQKGKKKQKRAKKKRKTPPEPLPLEEGEVTYRRLARDADEVKATEVEMEY